MTPYYDDGTCVIYHGDCRDVLPHVELVDLVLTDPPYPNAAGHFDDGIPAAEWFCRTYQAPTWLVFWHQLATPPVQLPLVARHIWHRSNTNRPDNYEAIYEFADAPERASRVFSYPVIYPGLTGCTEATGHPTQKSERLLRRLLALHPRAGTVVDPFMALPEESDMGIPTYDELRDERTVALARELLAEPVGESWARRCGQLEATVQALLAVIDRQA